ncbi:hypothetical protein STK_18600 [Sulfurisphaera tokodaii str. 7]|uniref:Uncharacterized protein n=3 Tax=Sulfurisphaera tokodaii TaxID=111955 RepID=Q96ZH4_SULTO|nr:hypothetical protein STK_18600 [Sulfurisphaera tokodaii str. 7]
MMVAIIVYTLYSVSYKIKTWIGLFFAFFVLIMMITMFIGAIAYLLSPSNISLAEAIIVNNASMLILLVYLFMNAKKLASNKDFSKIHIFSLSILTVLNEILMGGAFSLAYFGIKYFLTFYSAFLTTLNSYWFFYPMMAEMLALYLIDYLKSRANKELFALIGITTFPPTILNFSQWIYSSIFIDVILSLIGIINSRGLWRYLYIITAISVVSTLFIPTFFDIIIIIDMILYYVYLLNRSKVS